MKRAIVCTSLGVWLLIGCESSTPSKEAFFEPEEEPRLADQMLHTQAARGARADGNLFAAHFDGDTVNALGRARLDLMLADNSAAFPLTVYVTANDGADVSARQNSVRAYLLDAGLTAAQFQTLPGPNPGTLHRASDQLENLAKTDTLPTQGAETVEQAPAAMSGDGFNAAAK